MEIENDIDELNDGAILSVHVQNFFCHDNFRVDFKERVTFIVGRNGSGKSAILTALVVGLGGRALDTKRGKNFQSFVKKDANSAMIEIKIKNSSPRAYKREVYGDQITIVKTILSSGTSSYKIRLASGQLVVTTSKEVNAIVLAHNIQVNNPISVLNQDDARDFSLKIDPKKLYNLFKRATNLDVTEDNYEKAIFICNKAVNLWERKNRYCNELQSEYNKWLKLYEQMQTRENIATELKMLKFELNWSEITDAEHEVKIIREKCDKQEAKCEKIARNIGSMEENLASAATESIKKQLEESKMKKTGLDQQLQELERGKRDVRQALDEGNAFVSRQVELLKREKKKVHDYQQEIQSIGSGGAASQRAELEERAGACAAAAAEARARYATLQNDAQQAGYNAAQAADALQAARAALDARARRRNNLQQQVRELESRGADSLAVYGAEMSELCARVRRAAERGHFSAPPRGPVGQYLKVKEKKWGGALEHIIGHSMLSFCVNTSNDSRKLIEIMDQVYKRGGKPTVTCSKFLDAHDVSRSSVRAGPHTSALQALHVADPVVANFLVDNLALERVLLVPEHDDAVALSSARENVPPNCSKIVTLDCTEYYPAPHYRCYGGRVRPARYLHLSSAERKLQLLSEIDDEENNLLAHQAKVQELSETLQSAQDTKRDTSLSLQQLRATLLRREADQRSAEAALEQARAPQHSVLDEELDFSQQRVQVLSDNLKELTGKEEAYRRNLDEYDSKIRKVKEKLAEVTAVCRQLSNEIDQEEIKFERGASERRGLQNRLKEEREKLVQGKEILADKEAAVAKKVASTKGPRVDNPRDKTMITNLIMQSKKKINSMVQTNVSREEVEQQRDVAEQNYRRMQALLEQLRALINRIKRTADEHLKFCYNLKIEIGRHVGMHFMATLVTRGFHGQIKIDHKEETLELVVSGREGARSANSTASLSGGERSYSTVAFITALWECVELPFYFMDEFDVFMDDVNRQVVVELLLELARRLEVRQFVFLTPNAARLATHAAPVPFDVISLGDPVR